MSRLGIRTTAHEWMHVHKKRGEWWLNQQLQWLMGAWVIEKGSKWVKEWKHKRDRSAREVWKRGCQEQIAVAACRSAAGKIRGGIKRNSRGIGAARVRKRWNNTRTDVKWWNETSSRGGWGGGNQKVKDGDNAAAEKGLEATENSQECQKKTKQCPMRIVRWVVRCHCEKGWGRSGWVDQTWQPVRSTAIERAVRRKDKASADKKKLKQSNLDGNRQFRQAGQQTSFPSFQSAEMGQRSEAQSSLNLIAQYYSLTRLALPVAVGVMIPDNNLSTTRQKRQLHTGWL